MILLIKVGVENEVTTIMDAGITGAENIKEFYNITRDIKTNVYALINILKYGIVEQDELADISKIDCALVEKRIRELTDFIVVLKARMSDSVIGKNGITPLKMTKELQKKG